MEMDAAVLSNVAEDNNYIRVKLLTPVGVLDREKQLGVVREVRDIVAAAASSVCSSLTSGRYRVLDERLPR